MVEAVVAEVGVAEEAEDSDLTMIRRSKPKARLRQAERGPPRKFAGRA